MDFPAELTRLAELEKDYHKKLAIFREVGERSKRDPVLSQEYSNAWREVEIASRATFDLAQSILRHAQESVQTFIKEHGLQGVLLGAVASRDFVETFNLDQK